MLVVSFCNRPAPGGCIAALVDARSGLMRRLDHGRSDLTTACGLAQDDAYLYSACGAGSASYLAIFDKRTFRRCELLPLPEVEDVHSICLDGRAIVAVSTGTDAVVRVPLDAAARAEILWRASDARSDTHHLNAVAWHDGHLLCCGFDPVGTRRSRKSADRSADVYDVSAETRLIDGLRHPHSLTARDGALYLLESARGILRTPGGIVAGFDGYARGLAASEDGAWIVGTSVGRRSSSAPDVVLNPDDPGTPTGTCALHALSQAPVRVAQSLDCGTLADEIYDILPLTPTGSPAPTLDPGRRAALADAGG